MQNELNIVINQIKEDILSAFPFLKSLYLIGSFGRDEGSYKLFDNKIKIYNDIDLVGIIEDKDNYLISHQDIISFNNTYSKRLSIPFFDFNIVTKTEILSQKPSIQSYDFKYGSKLLFGQDYSKDYTINISDLTKYEFIRLILNRSAGLLTGKYYNKSTEYNIIQLYKAYIAVGDSLLYHIDGFYEPNYKKRILKFLEQKDLILNFIDEIAYNKIINSYHKKLDCETPYEIENTDRVRKLLLLTIYLYQNYNNKKYNKSLFFNLLEQYSNITPHSFRIFILKNFIRRKAYMTSKMTLFLLIFTLNNTKSFIDRIFYKFVLLPFSLNRNTEDEILTKLWFKYCH